MMFMKLLLKLIALKILSIIPFGRRIYYWTQIHISKTVLPVQENIMQKYDVAKEYYDLLVLLNEIKLLREGIHLEIGSGWNPVIPLAFYTMGSEKQYLTDVQRVLRKEHLSEIVDVLSPIISEYPCTQRSLPEVIHYNDYLSKLGIIYTSPCRNSIPYEKELISVITATQVLQYVMPNQLEELFSEAARLLKKKGLFIGSIHLYSDYFPIDSKFSKYFYLRYSKQFFRRIVNNSITPYNCLKGADYIKMIEKFPFKIKYWNLNGYTEDDIKELELVKIHNDYSSYLKEELLAAELTFIAEKV